MKITNCRFIAIAFAAFALYAVTSPAQDAPPKWSGSSGMGLTVNKGNSDNLMFNTHFDIGKDFSKSDSVKFGVSYTFGQDKTGGVKRTTTSALQAFGDYKHLFSERMYGNLRLDFFHDDVASVKYRVLVGPALGYFFIKNDKTKLSAEAGPSYVIEKVGNNETSYLALRISERLEHTINKSWRIWQSADFFPKVDDFDNYLIVAELGTEASLTERLSLRVVLQDRYNSEPAAGRKKNDLTLISGVSYKF
jgi:putative salt-induced outer membrane protein YdiY